MKTATTLLLAALALGASSLIVSAQDAPERPQGRGGRQAPPVMAALDANKDGEIDAAEIANAATALKTLDKNGDGKLSREEVRPARGPRGDGDGARRERRRPGAAGAEKKEAQ